MQFEHLSLNAGGKITGQMQKNMRGLHIFFLQIFNFPLGCRICYDFFLIERFL